MNVELTNVYVLELEGGYYYIGSTKDRKYRQHLDNLGLFWTRLHQPIMIIEELINVDASMANVKTKEYMAKYGIDKVRGGSYTKRYLEPEDIKILQRLDEN